MAKKEKNRDYWKARYDQIEQAQNNKSVAYIQSLEEKYRYAAQEIDSKINKWYNRIATNNGISITEAKRLLSKSELDEFKWTVEQYIKAGKENALDQSWVKELENASSKFHINRLEAMKLEARHQVEIATGGLVDDVDGVMRNVYTDTFYRSCYEVQKGTGIGFDVSKLNSKQVQKVLTKPWSVDGMNFSEKLWGNKAKLINNVDRELSRMVLTGESPRVAISNIRKSMDSSLTAAKRLVLTEQAYFTSKAQKDSYNELEIEEFEVVETLDGKTCEICGGWDGKHFPIDEMSPGINSAPFHPMCRGTTCPYFDDAFTNGKRLAIGPDGERYTVPEKMTYEQWKNHFAGGGTKEELQKIVNNDIVEIKEFIPAKTIQEAEQYARSLGVSLVSFKGADITTANAMNKSLMNALEYAPEIKTNMNFYGVSQERNKLLKADLEEYYNKWYRENYKGLNDEWYTKYAKKAASSSVGKVDTNNLAMAYSGKVNSNDDELIAIVKKYSGVGVNLKMAKDSKSFVEAMEYSVKTKFHPVGCETIESVFDHEFGHQIDYAFDVSRNKEIRELWDTMSYGDKVDKLSRYATTNIKEFVAEGYAEYLNNKEPREVSKKIGKVIEKLVKKE